MTSGPISGTRGWVGGIHSSSSLSPPYLGPDEAKTPHFGSGPSRPPLPAPRRPLTPPPGAPAARPGPGAEAARPRAGGV